MNQYMIAITLPEFPNQDFKERIPAQRRMVDELMDRGVIQAYGLANDRTRVWMVMVATSEKKAMDILSDFPLITYMHAEIQELAFFDSVSASMPKLILN